MEGKKNSDEKVATIDAPIRNKVERHTSRRHDPVAPRRFTHRDLMRAITRGDVGAVRSMFDSATGKFKVDPSARDNDAIIEAARRGNLAIVELLLKDSRVDSTAQGNTAARQASQASHGRFGHGGSPVPMCPLAVVVVLLASARPMGPRKRAVGAVA